MVERMSEKEGMNAAQVELCILLCLVYVSWGLTDSIQVPENENENTNNIIVNLTMINNDKCQQ